jgi:hypothetical protein
MKLFWNMVAIVLAILAFLFVVWFLTGCDDSGSPPTRLAFGIKSAGGGAGSSAGYWYYITPMGDPITREGCRMNINHYDASYQKPNGLGGMTVVPVPGVQIIETSGVTGAHGRVSARGVRVSTDYYPYTIYSAAAGVMANSGAGATLRYSLNSEIPAQAMHGDGPLHYASSSHRSLLTQSEISALSSATSDSPNKGFSVASVGLGYQGGSMNDGYGRDEDYFMAINLETPEEYVRFATPSFYTAVVKTASAVNLTQFEMQSNIRSGASPDGIDIPLYVAGSNADGKTHVVRSDYFLPVDSELPIAWNDTMTLYDRWTPLPGDPNDMFDDAQYARFLRSDWLDVIDPNLLPVDPNTVEDENLFVFVHRLDTAHPLFMAEGVAIPERFFDAQVIPIGKEDDQLFLTPNAHDFRVLWLAVEYWMTDEPTWDVNGDGIVNYEDLVHLK